MKQLGVCLSLKEAADALGVSPYMVETHAPRHGLYIYKLPDEDDSGKGRHSRVCRKSFKRYCLRWGEMSGLAHLGWSPSAVLWGGPEGLARLLREYLPFPLHHTADGFEAGWLVSMHEPTCLIFDSGTTGAAQFRPIARAIRAARPWLRLIGLDYADQRKLTAQVEVDFDERVPYPFDPELIAELITEGG